LVVLHPYQLLPNRLPLFRRRGDHWWASYLVTNDGLLRETSDPEDINAPLFPPLMHSTTRESRDQLNPWFVIMNAAIKFQRFSENYGLDKLHPSMRANAEQTLQILDLLNRNVEPTQKYLASHGSTRQSPRARKVVRYDDGNGSDLNPEGGGRDEGGGGDAGPSYSGGNKAGETSIRYPENHSNEANHA
jgi:hypothetical protein